jgi:selenium metabolism protein YedF
MSGTIVNAKGQLCPKPLIMTKKALAELPPGEEMTVFVDNQASKENVYRFLQDHGIRATCAEADGVFTIRAKKTVAERPAAEAKGRSQAAATKPHVIAIKNDKMGFGPEELGQILIKALINTIQDASPLPGAIVFYNKGIHLALDGSPVLDSLQELESRGVKILVCGTCLDYFGKKELVRVGEVSNLYEILQIMTEAGHVIAP